MWLCALLVFVLLVPGCPAVLLCVLCVVCVSCSASVCVFWLPMWGMREPESCLLLSSMKCRAPSSIELIPPPACCVPEAVDSVHKAPNSTSCCAGGGEELAGIDSRRSSGEVQT